MENSSSPLDTLRQLKEMLDAGALTATEFEALKKQLLFNNQAAFSPGATEPSAPVAGPTGSATPPAGPPAYVAPVPPPLGPPVGGERPPSSPNAFTSPVPGSSPPWVTEVNEGPGGPAGTPDYFSVTAGPEPLPVPSPEPVASWSDSEFPEPETPAARSPLALILSIGGLLALLGLVLYLSLNQRPSEHLSSTSKTAADNLVAPIETGPQARPLPATVAEPETIRVTPAHPAPAFQGAPETQPQPVTPDDPENPDPAAAPDSTAKPSARP
ncbi:SHOCT domain-containing protein [Hymenobacter sp. BT664]|uniref:SHOCT domain-containing protein n=1 Tax=Hymenobacter montanus TaxID=2771359 RepID=A0A927BBB0_9BACT|nr:SHOCT domain-containing protein [Hymenobacter montanus]MBD2767556.1 SHOCT domain-containing protein [Hymenobacter montanus]